MISKLLSERKEFFLNYIKESPISKELKIPLLVFLTEVERNDDIYYCYSELFVNAFVYQTHPDNDLVNKINVAAYFMYSYLNLKDSLMDNHLPLKEIKKVLLLSSIVQEESIKILGSIFPPENAFWTIWNKRRSEYLSAKNCLEDKISWAEFEQLAEAKSAFAKVSIDIWYIQSSGDSKEITYQNLLESHRLFTIGFQILDDLIDMAKDINDGHFNIAYHELKNELSLKGIETEDVNLLLKHLYIQGVAEKLLHKALSMFTASLDILDKFEDKVKIWQHFVSIQKRQVEFFLLQIDSYFKRLYARKTLSTEPLLNSLKIPTTSELINQSLVKACSFLSSQQHDGAWEDFYNNAGTSNVWTTGYVLLNVGQTSYLDPQTKQKAIDFLLNSKYKNGWGYTTNAPLVDTDSTTCVLYALNKAGNNVDLEHKSWIKGQNDTGGFATFNDDSEVNAFLANSVRSVAGWTQSHTCVSALASYYLSQTDNLSPSHLKLNDYLLQNRNENGIWDAYWWTSPVYATTYAVLALGNSNFNLYEAEISHAIQFIVDNHFSDGYLKDDFNVNGSVFYTSLFLQTLLSHPALFKKYPGIIDQSADWLLHKQFNDGSFPSSLSMRVPSSSTKDITKFQLWEKKAKQQNMVAEDYGRIFTTSATINALNKYRTINFN